LSSENDILGQRLSDTDIERLVVGVVLLGGTGSTYWTLQQDVIAAHSEEATLGADDYIRYPGQFSWRAATAFDSVAVLRGSWQYAPEPRIASPASFQLGGAYTVRGYEAGVLSAARGAAASAEIHWAAPRIADAFFFADYGFVDGESFDLE